jgi:hypothetical protein
VARQQFVILSAEAGGGSGLPPIGRRSEIIARLRDLNTGPSREGESVLHGPGIRIEFADEDPVRQMLLTVVEEEIAWPVILRIGRAMGWKLLDPTSGRELTP